MKRPAPATIMKMEHEFSFIDELDPAWAIRQIGIVCEEGTVHLRDLNSPTPRDI
jgi:hypothetical protein